MPRKEQWLPVPDYPNYEVSDRGRVRSLDRESPGRNGSVRKLKGQILAQVWAGGTASRHYRACTLYQDGKPKQIPVHILVLKTFKGDRPQGMQGCHSDDNPDNNTLPNLYWGTPIQNGQDKIRNGNCWKTNITHCPQGHEYSEENTYRIPSTGHRLCRACIKAKNKGNANKDRTHCPQGHPYDEENTYRVKGSNQRQCKTCTRDRAREYQRKRRKSRTP